MSGGNRKPDGAALGRQVLDGDRRALARAITLIESTRRDHRKEAARLLEVLLPRSGQSIRIGISGVPGVGKSTFIETFGGYLLEQGHKVAVLAVDPSSRRTGGSILGDKTRMEHLARDERAFIRPSPTAGTLGGVARRTRESMLAVEAAGFDVVIVETVGVGQSETAVADMVDLFMLLLLPGGGDELQGIKKGIVEIADLLLVNKADGELKQAASRAAAEYQSAVRMLRPAAADWIPPVNTCSALTGDGIAPTWERIGEYRDLMRSDGRLEKRRAEQARAWMWSEVDDALLAAFREHDGVRERLEALEQAVMDGRTPATAAAQELLAVFLDGVNGNATD
jgi:LAO/AO transport system kinase